jgi:hypothetical protein
LDPAPPSTFVRSRWLFLRLLGLVYGLAFLSLAMQMTGLVGTHGILPVAPFLTTVRERYGAFAYYEWPTLAWFFPGDIGLSLLCWGGVAVSLLLVAGVAPIATGALTWLLYLSLTVAGQTFLEFQWDSLLLESGLLAVLYAPASWRDRLTDGVEPSAIVRWVIWLLAFKVTFLSGITKILSRDPTWANLTALSYHYETQPIPTWTSWFMYQLPHWVHSWSTGAMFLIEIGVSWLVFLPVRFARLRLTACMLMVLLQAAIAATGNYGFFNLLTIVLYLSLLDDRTVGRVLRFATARRHGPAKAGHYDRSASNPEACREQTTVLTEGRWRSGANIVGLIVAVLSVMTLVREMDRTRGRRGLLDRSVGQQVLTWASPFRSVNGYGLFRVMTTERPEIVLEVSTDGSIWKEQEFRWKAGDVLRRPAFVEPHMPRLDWQMWFAALDPDSAQDWLVTLAERLVAGEPAVTRLLGPNPLDGRPRFVRLAYYQYHFTSSSERAATGAWWKREFVGYLTASIPPQSPG